MYCVWRSNNCVARGYASVLKPQSEREQLFSNEDNSSKPWRCISGLVSYCYDMVADMNISTALTACLLLGNASAVFLHYYIFCIFGVEKPLTCQKQKRQQHTGWKCKRSAPQDGQGNLNGHSVLMKRAEGIMEGLSYCIGENHLQKDLKWLHIEWGFTYYSLLSLCTISHLVFKFN